MSKEKFDSPVKAEAILAKNGVRIVSGVIDTPSSGLGLACWSAIDYLVNHCSDRYILRAGKAGDRKEKKEKASE